MERYFCVIVTHFFIIFIKDAKVQIFPVKYLRLLLNIEHLNQTVSSLKTEPTAGAVLWFSLTG
jgi:hypothetical protein